MDFRFSVAGHQTVLFCFNRMKKKCTILKQLKSHCFLLFICCKICDLRVLSDIRIRINQHIFCKRELLSGLVRQKVRLILRQITPSGVT